jgi:hypothetical protein
LSKHTEIPAREATKIIDAVPFLREVAEGGHPVLGRKVAVYGGGNTAMDAARTAKRLGAGDALIVYRRTRGRMPAHEEEAAAAEREGVTINWLRTITAFDGPEMTVEVMELGPDGYPRPTGTYETLAADTLILALGQDAETGFLHGVPGIEFKKDGTVVVGPDMMTGCPGVFALGAAATRPRLRRGAAGRAPRLDGAQGLHRRGAGTRPAVGGRRPRGSRTGRLPVRAPAGHAHLRVTRPGLGQRSLRPGPLASPVETMAPGAFQNGPDTLVVTARTSAKRRCLR